MREKRFLLKKLKTYNCTDPNKVRLRWKTPKCNRVGPIRLVSFAAASWHRSHSPNYRLITYNFAKKGEITRTMWSIVLATELNISDKV